MAAVRSWIFLRGLSRGVGHWGDFVELFQARFPQDEVELIDIPGNGERNGETSPTAISDFVADIRSHSEFLMQGKQVHLLALSLGGMIAMDWAHKYPDEVLSLNVICTSTSTTSTLLQRLQLSSLPILLKVALSNKNPADVERHILQMISNNKERQDLLMDRLVDYSRRYPASIENFFRQILAASTSKAPVKPNIPIQIFGSWGDKMVSPECSLQLGKYWGVEPLMHPWSGHDIPIDDPEWLLKGLSIAQV